MKQANSPDRAATASRPDAATFIRDNMRLAPVPGLPEILLYTAHPASWLGRLTEPDAASDQDAATDECPSDEDDEPQPPYWAYVWAGGAVLARHILDHPEILTDRRVLDLGAGGGLVGIAAAKAGARDVTASETDRNGIAAIDLNAAANGVAISTRNDDLTAGAPPGVDLALVGDLFYGPELAARVTAFLDRCLERGIEVLVGDPGRAYLPRTRLRLLAEHAVVDFGEATPSRKSCVFAFERER